VVAGGMTVHPSKSPTILKISRESAIVLAVRVEELPP